MSRILAIVCPDCRGTCEGPPRELGAGKTMGTRCQLCAGKGAVFVEVRGPAPRAAVE